MAWTFGSRNLLGRRRTASPYSLVALVIGLFFVSGNSWFQGRRFMKACGEITEGQPLADAEAVLQQRKGNRVVFMPPQASKSVFQFNTFGAGSRTCEIEHADGVVVSARSH